MKNQKIDVRINIEMFMLLFSNSLKFQKSTKKQKQKQFQGLKSISPKHFLVTIVWLIIQEIGSQWLNFIVPPIIL